MKKNRTIEKNVTLYTGMSIQMVSWRIETFHIMGQLGSSMDLTKCFDKCTSCR